MRSVAQPIYAIRLTAVEEHVVVGAHELQGAVSLHSGRTFLAHHLGCGPDRNRRKRLRHSIADFDVSFSVAAGNGLRLVNRGFHCQVEELCVVGQGNVWMHVKTGGRLDSDPGCAKT
jgi:hypothetical protein